MTTPKFDVQLIQTDKDWTITKQYITFKDPPTLQYLNSTSLKVLRKGNINFLTTLTLKSNKEVEELYEDCFQRLCRFSRDKNISLYIIHYRTCLEMKRILKYLD